MTARGAVAQCSAVHPPPPKPERALLFIVICSQRKVAVEAKSYTGQQARISLLSLPILGQIFLELMQMYIHYVFMGFVIVQIFAVLLLIFLLCKTIGIWVSNNNASPI
jgi:hypothetical protein